MSRSDVINVKENASSPPQVESPETKKEFKVGKWYKCIQGNGIDVKEGGFYKYLTASSFDNTSGGWSGEFGVKSMKYNRFDIDSESSFNSVVEVNITREIPSGGTTGQVWLEDKGYVTLEEHVHGGDIRSVQVSEDGKSIDVFMEGKVKAVEVQLTINKQEENIMGNANNRRIVTVQVFDLDPALDVEHSLVHVFEDVVTEEDNATTLTELLHTGKLVEPLAAHNKVRTAQDNKDILSRTGKKVKLEAIKVKNLHFKYV